MGGWGFACTANPAVSQWPEMARIALGLARGLAPSSPGICSSERSSWSNTPGIASFIHGQGPPPWEMK